MAKFKTIITTVGAAKIAAVLAGTGSIVLDNTAKMAVGDGSGTLPTPNPAQTKLVNEVHRASINKASIDASDPKNIIAELVIPPETGGFWLREMALYDAAGTLLAVGNMAETYKPSLSEGAGRKMVIRMVIAVSEVSAVTITMDTSTVMATQDYVDTEIDKHAKSRNHPDATLTAKGFTQLNSATDSASETQAATPKAVKTVMDATSLKAPLASPALSGVPTAPTAPPGTNTQQLANTQFVLAAIASLINSAPGVLDTLGELAAALGNDANFAATMTAALAAKAPLLSPALSGLPTAPTAAPGTSTLQLANTAFVMTAVASLVNSSPAALDTLKELADALGNDANFATTMTNALAGKQPKDTTLTNISGKDVAGLLQYLGLVFGSNPGNIVTSGSTQPLYKTTLPNIGYAELPERGVFANAGAMVDSVTKIMTTLLTKAGAGGWALGQSVGTYLGAGGTPDDLAHVLISTDGAGFTRRWYLYNNGKLVGPAGDMASVNFVQDAIAALVASSPAALDTLNELAAALGNDPNFATTMLNALAGKQPLDTTLTSLSGKNIAQLCAYLGLVVGSNTGNVVTSGSTQPVYKTTLPAVGYTDLAPHGLFANADAMVDSVTKILTTLLTKPGVGGWTLGQSVGTYLGAGGTPDDLAHVLISTDGAGFTRRWYLYNNGKLVGPAGEFALQEWVNNQFLKLDGATIAGFALNDANRPYIRHKDSDAVVELQRKNQASLAVTGWSKDSSTGLIEMWGTVANVADDTPSVVSFPTAFPNACLAFTPTLKRSTKTNDNTAMLSVWGAANDNSSATVIFQSNNNGGDVRSGDITWRATGY